MSTANLWNCVCEAASQFARDRFFTMKDMDALCAAVLKYGKATGQPGYSPSAAFAPKAYWEFLTEAQRADLARFVLAEVDQGPAGVVDSKTVWLREMSAAQIFEAMSEEQRSDFDKMFGEGDRFASIERRLEVLEAAVNRLDVDKEDDERGRGVGPTGGAYEKLEDAHRRLREEHSILSSALEIEKRRADQAEEHRASSEPCRGRWCRSTPRNHRSKGGDATNDG